MAARKTKKSTTSAVRKTSSASSTNTALSFFNSRLFLFLSLIAIFVFILAIFSSMNNPSKQTMDQGGEYRIDTSNLQNDSSATGVRPENLK